MRDSQSSLRLVLTAFLRPVSRLVSKRPKSEWELEDLDALCLAAVRAGDLLAVKRAVNAGARIDGTLRYGPPLALALASDDLSLIQYLIAAGADVNARASMFRGDPLLHIAAESSARAVTSLLEAGADADVIDSHQRTPLHRAASRGRAAAAKALLTAGADVRAKDCVGDTPLHAAGSYSLEDEQARLATIEVLLNAGAEVDTHCKSGISPLVGMAQWSSADSIQLLLKAGADVRAMDGNRETALHKAAWRGNTASIELLLKAGAEVDATSRSGFTPLECACSSGVLAAIQLLLDWQKRKGVVAWREPGSEECDLGFTNAMHRASGSGSVAAVELLLSRGWKLNARNMQGKTPLHFAAEACKIAVIERILGAGVDPNTRTSDGDTPLHLACRKSFEVFPDPAVEQRIAAVRVLLQAGADPRAFNRAGHCPHYRAIDECRTILLGAITEAEANPFLQSRGSERPG